VRQCLCAYINLRTQMQGGHCIVSAALDRKVFLWDADKLEFIGAKTGNAAAIRCLSFDPADNLLVGGGYEGTLLCWGELHGDAAMRYDSVMLLS
jgi:WD40 repeat protein